MTEKEALAAILQDGSHGDFCRWFVRNWPNYAAFASKHRYKLIFEAVTRLLAQDGGVDWVTLTADLKDRDLLVAAGGPEFIAELLDESGPTLFGEGNMPDGPCCLLEETRMFAHQAIDFVQKGGANGFESIS